MINPVCF